MCQPNISVGAFAIADAVNIVLLMLRIGVSTVLLLHHPTARGEDLPTATVAAERGHQVTLFDAAAEVGGQFNVAKRIPGKEEFHETLRYFRKRIEETGVQVRLNTRVTAREKKEKYTIYIYICPSTYPFIYQCIPY